MSQAGATSPAWLIWYGLRIGLTLDETLDMLMGELLELIAVEQIKCEGAKLRDASENDFFAFLEKYK